MEAFCQRKADAFYGYLCTVITPREMYLIEPDGEPDVFDSLHPLLVEKWPVCFTIMFGEVCNSFRRFSDWCELRTPGVPNNEEELDQKDDEWDPYRDMLLEHIHNRAVYTAVRNTESIVAFYVSQARARWTKLRNHLRVSTIVWFWKVQTHRPGRAAFLSGKKDLEAVGILA
tara:strand:- start:131 stop:646 length:516 start_codon:yes stop_codon:yes gene_type:complete